MKILSAASLLLILNGGTLQAELAQQTVQELSPTDYTHITSVTQQISQELEHFTEAATETKVNEPYQPYIISVLNGKDLEKLGISTLQEALELIPGVDIATDVSDMRTSVFRGSNPFAFGQAKLLIDGMLANDTFLDSFATYLYMPIEMIKRIEVVRELGRRTDGINEYGDLM